MKMVYVMAKTILPSIGIQKISDHHVKLLIRLQAAFGLRREEAIKFILHFADRGNRIVLKSTWTKGARN